VAELLKGLAENDKYCQKQDGEQQGDQQNVHFLLHAIRLHENTQSMSLLGAKRTSVFAAHMSAFDPKRT
jgi:hypothetical protein